MKALFIGLGGVGQRHLRNLLRQVPDAQIGAVRTRDRTFEIGDDLVPDHSTDIVAKYGIRRFADLSQGVDWRPDLAVVANPSSLHAATALTLVEAGIPLLLEKPLACDLASAETLLAEAQARGVPVMAGFMQRFHPATRRLAQWLAEERIGPLLSAQSICHNWLIRNHSYEPIESFYLGRRDLGGGVVLSETHNTDLLGLLFGRPERLWCVGGRLSGNGPDVDDTVTALLEYRRQGRPFPVSLHMSMVERPSARRLTINGERGRLEWDLLAARVSLDDEAGGRRETYELPDFQRNSMFAAEMAEFLAALAEGRPPEPSLAQAMDGHRIAMAMLDSLVCGEPVEVG